MAYVKAKENPVIINESLMGKILKKTPELAGVDYKAYNPKIIDVKNRKVIKGKDAKQMIEKYGNYVYIQHCMYEKGVDFFIYKD